MKTTARSVRAQARAGTLDRNTTIIALCLSGRISQVEIAKHFGLSRQSVNTIYRRYVRQHPEALVMGKSGWPAEREEGINA